MSNGIDVRVTPALHPTNIEKIEGYDEDTALVLGQTVTAFSEAYLGIGQVHTAREAAKRNPTWNEAQQVIATQDLADRVFAKVAKGFDREAARLGTAIQHLEGELSQPVEARASHPIAQEIRAHIKALPAGQRMPFIKGAIEAGDHDTAQAALGTVPYLSGIDANTRAVLTRMYREQAQPALAQRLKAMQGAKALIEERGGLVMRELEKAVGMPPHKVQALRKARNAAEQAFVLKDA